MNPLFWLLVWIVAFIAWVASRPLWEPFGRWLVKRQTKINETLNKTEIDEEKEDDF